MNKEKNAVSGAQKPERRTKMKLKAFTLAEVLISLTIIGVIAAITVPALIQRTNKQEYVTALQKAYSTLSQATNMIIAENGSPKCDDEGWACSHQNIHDMYFKYLNNAKDCGTEAGCFEQYNGKVKYLSGTYYYQNINNIKTAKFILSDGMQVLFRNLSAGCSGYCAEVYVDINGKKSPNQLGRDLFLFNLKENGLIPAGCGNTDCYINNNGWYCACKVLREGAMNY